MLSGFDEVLYRFLFSMMNEMKSDTLKNFSLALYLVLLNLLLRLTFESESSSPVFVFGDI